MTLELPQNQRIIYGVLNWGLGHASRSIPLIRRLIAQGNELILASDGEALDLLRKEFPNLGFISLRAYNVRYTGKLWSIVVKNSPNILAAIISENFRLKKLVREYRPDIIISDSRFGFYHKTRPSYVISHQLKLKSHIGWLGFLVNSINAFLLNSYTEVWVPDEEDRRLSGDLSLNKKIKKLRFIGALSRMKRIDIPNNYKLSVILSGPEPSRSFLEKKLVTVLENYTGSVCFVRGTNKGDNLEFPQSWDVHGLLATDTLNRLLCSAELVISRSGYSSILDYYKLGTRAILIPTPGQSEQEYLGVMLDGRYGFKSIREDALELLPQILQKEFLKSSPHE